MRRRDLEQHHATEIADLRSLMDSQRNEIAAVRRSQAEPSEWLARVTTKSVIVHQKGDTSIEGLLMLNLADGIVLRSASLLKSGAPSTPLAGEVFIPRTEIALIQLAS